MGKLWGPVTLADVVRLDAVIKDKALPTEARAAAHVFRVTPPRAPRLDGHREERSAAGRICPLAVRPAGRLVPAAAPADA